MNYICFSLLLAAVFAGYEIHSYIAHGIIVCIISLLFLFSIVGAQGKLQTTTVKVQQRKSPVNIPITPALSRIVSAAVKSGGHVVTNIAPPPVAAAATSKGLHSTAQTPGKNC